ncbi:histone-like nucleoid-structuring protein Lsr2 [Curtobacterium flaccumfaciens]|uniref:histone-like nucleoid-structuring protein Lsr2 n=1 Tax=Curtobacterium flaccumfaciens TaxID=2035 RepID=UPI001127A5B2|nr:Lsr2 family protein [Curtobacterium flaccumfaciens]TPG09385.1 Lsr2 family protein [Curtobacterium flaccumfaciens]
MAKQTIITDDLDQTQGAETRTFMVGVKTYEIDLTDANYEKLEAALAPFIDAARVVRTDKMEQIKQLRRQSRSDLTEIREWAKANGHSVSERGRIPNSVMDAYDARIKRSGTLK